MNLVAAAKTLKEGRSVVLTARGKSMMPLIHDGDKVRLTPAKKLPEKGDIVLAKVGGSYYLHKVTHVTSDYRFMIGNNKGRYNGFASEIVGLFAGIVEK